MRGASHRGIAAVTLLSLITVWPVLGCCPFCEQQGKTLAKEIAEAKLVVYGTLANAKINVSADGTDQSTTDLLIEEVVKEHEFIKDKKKLVLPRYMPNTNEPVKFLIFCDVYKDKVDPYRGIPSNSKDMVGYLKGAIKLPEKDMVKRLAFFLPYLDNADTEIAGDAYREFAMADYPDVEALVKTVETAKLHGKVVSWLKDKETAPYRYGFYGMLLGLVGGKEDGAIFHELLEDPERGLITGMDGVMAGYVRVDKDAGWKYVLGQLRDKELQYARRYAALRAARFLWKYQPDILPRSELMKGFVALLDQSDLADLAIDDLRKLKVWSETDTILALYSKASHQVPQIRRAILRYALQAPGEKPKAFIAEAKQKEPKLVEQVEEFLKLELPDQ